MAELARVTDAELQQIYRNTARVLTTGQEHTYEDIIDLLKYNEHYRDLLGIVVTGNGRHIELQYESEEAYHNILAEGLDCLHHHSHYRVVPAYEKAKTTVHALNVPLGCELTFLLDYVTSHGYKILSSARLTVPGSNINTGTVRIQCLKTDDSRILPNYITHFGKRRIGLRHREQRAASSTKSTWGSNRAPPTDADPSFTFTPPGVQTPALNFGGNVQKISFMGPSVVRDVPPTTTTTTTPGDGLVSQSPSVAVPPGPTEEIVQTEDIFIDDELEMPDEDTTVEVATNVTGNAGDGPPLDASQCVVSAGGLSRMNVEETTADDSPLDPDASQCILGDKKDDVQVDAPASPLEDGEISTDLDDDAMDAVVQLLNGVEAEITTNTSPPTKEEPSKPAMEIIPTEHGCTTTAVDADDGGETHDAPPPPTEIPIRHKKRTKAESRFSSGDDLYPADKISRKGKQTKKKVKVRNIVLGAVDLTYTDEERDDLRRQIENLTVISEDHLWSLCKYILMFNKTAKHTISQRWVNAYALALAVYVGPKEQAHTHDPGSRITRLPDWVKGTWAELPTGEDDLHRAAVDILLQFNAYKPPPQKPKK